MRRLQLATEVDPWLDRFRTTSDALADRAAAELAEAKLARGGDLVAAMEARARQAGACRELLEQANDVPTWVDFDRMVAGARLGLRNAVPAALSLLLGSLVESYCSANAAKVLVRAGRLEQDTLRRLRDTAEFVLVVAQARGPRPGSAAHRHILKVRLVHAFVRRGMVARKDWDARWGHPVNQEDYASTLFEFSHVCLRGMAKLGVHITPEGEDSVHHGYRWVGHIIGVDPELLTASREEERALYEQICRRQLHPDADSRVLAHALVQAMANRPPFFLPASALYGVSRHLLGDGLADRLEFPRPGRTWRYLPGVLASLSGAQRWAERLPTASVGLERLGARFAQALIDRGFGR